MQIVSERMFVIREKGTDRYKRNSQFNESLDSNCKSAIKLYETENNAKTAIRRCQDYYDIVPVNVVIEITEE